MRDRLLISACRLQDCHLWRVSGTRDFVFVFNLFVFADQNFCVRTQIFENSSGTRAATTVLGSVVGVAMENITYDEVVTVICDADHRLGGQNDCSIRQYSVKCEDDGTFGYTGGFTSSTPPQDLRCEPVSCNVSQISVTNGQLNTSSDQVKKGQVATLTCDPTYHIFGSVANYQGTYPLPSHPGEHHFSCQDTCTFTSHTQICKKRGCAAVTDTTSWTRTTDDAKSVTLTLPIPVGSKKEGDEVNVQCPHGYLVDNNNTEPADTTLNQRVSTCTCNDTTVPAVCELSPVHCSRRSCPDFQVTGFLVHENVAIANMQMHVMP